MSNQTDWRHHKYSKDRRYFAIHAGKSLKGSDVVQGYGLISVCFSVSSSGLIQMFLNKTSWPSA